MPPSQNRLTRVILVGSALLVTAVDAAETGLHFKSYDTSNELLRMVLVTPSTHGDFLLEQGGKTQKVNGAVLEGLFTLRVKVPCGQLTQATRAYWALPHRPLLSADIPVQRCETPLQFPPVYVFERQGTCWLNSNGNTLWRTALEYSRLNHASVYQNMYALFLANRGAFAKEDIYRLTTPLLRCPTAQLLATITPDHARALFADADQFHRARANATPSSSPAQEGRHTVQPGPSDARHIARADVTSSRALLSAKGPSLKLIPRPSTPSTPGTADQCIIDTQGATLWHTAESYRQKHDITVYQALFALYQANPHSFTHGDITRLTTRLLRCPDPALLDQIPPKHAKRWYHAKVKR
ncbi:FimV/HubP family polar landmark protein [Aeromonas hydrophila]